MSYMKLSTTISLPFELEMTTICDSVGERSVAAHTVCASPALTVLGSLRFTLSLTPESMLMFTLTGGVKNSGDR